MKWTTSPFYKSKIDSFHRFKQAFKSVRDFPVWPIRSRDISVRSFLGTFRSRNICTKTTDYMMQPFCRQPKRWIELSRTLHMLRFSLCGIGKHVISFVLPVISARLACDLKAHYAELTKHIMSHKVAPCSWHERTVLFCCHWLSWTPHVVVARILVFMNNLFETKEHWTAQTCFPLTQVRIGCTQ